MKLNAMSVKNILGYVVTPLMLISVGYFVAVLQGYLKKHLNDNGTLALAVGLLLLLLAVLTILTYFKQKQHSAQQTAGGLSILILRSCALIVLAILLGTMIGLSGNLLLPFLTSTINHQSLSVLLLPLLGLMVIADYKSYRSPSAFYLLGAGFICSVTSYWLPTLANWSFLAIITLYSLKLFYMISRHLIQPYNKLVNKKTTPKTHLILFLSPLPKTFRRSQSTEDDTSAFPLLDEFKERAENWRKMDKSMENQGINWEMSYRSIHSQLFPSSDLPSKLQQVIVALSAPSKNKKGDKVDGSAAMVAEFFEGLQALMMLWNVSQPPQLKLLIKRENSSEKPFELTTFEPGKNYEMLGINSADFEETSAAVFFAVHTLIQQQVTESDIVIDITGWQKHTSVAGVLVATVTDVHNQYVDTNSKEVISYDFTFNDFTKLT